METYKASRYSDEELENTAKRFSSRGEFLKHEPKMYEAAKKRGLLDEICSHMPKRAGKPANFKWDITSLSEIANTCATREEFKEKHYTAYRAAVKRGLLDQVCAHMPKLKEKEWTVEKVKLLAAKYNTKSEFQKNEPNAYSAAIRLGCLDEVCAHMEVLWEPKWNDESTLQEMAKYSSRSEFQEKSPGAYSYARKSGLIEKMPSLVNERSYEELKQIALQYDSRSKFQENDPASYQAAYRRGILDEICQHMPKNQLSVQPPHNLKWTKETLEIEAPKHKNRYEFKKNNKSAFDAAKRLGLLEIFFPDKEEFRNTPYTEEEMATETKKHVTRCALKRNKPYLYRLVLKLNKQDLFSHMKKSVQVSFPENDLLEQIKVIHPEAKKLRENKIDIPGKPHIKRLELDIYIPGLNKGIEFDGRYWHSIKGLRRSHPKWPEEDIQNYHKIKDDYFLSKGIQILHIKEEDWINNNAKEVERCLEFLK